ncbi:MAG: hypothetical protein ACWA5L_07730 [bacterium]
MSRMMRNIKTALCALVMGVSPLASGAMAQYSPPGTIETATFGEDSFALGSLSQNDGALPRSLWQGADAHSVGYLLDHLPEQYTDPAWIDILRRTLLSPGEGPLGADTALTGKKVMALAVAGYYEEAASLAELSGQLQNRPELSQAIAYADMMRGDMDAACLRGAGLQQGRSTKFWLKMRTICYILNEESAAADLTYGLLREQGYLNNREQELFGALISNSKPVRTIPPLSGFEYVITRQMQLPLPLAKLDEADGAVLRALANESKAPKQARIYAAERALYFNIMPAEEVRTLFKTIQFPEERLNNASQQLADNRDNYLIDALVFQAVERMTQPELTLERTELIGEALRAADNLQRYTALSKLYAPATAHLEVIVNYAPYAQEFALSGILAEQPDIAERWISALAQDQTKPEGLSQAQDLLNLLAVRDVAAAEQIAYYAGLTVPTPAAIDPEKLPLSYSGDPSVLPDLVGIALEPGNASSQGVNALMGLVALQAKSNGDLERIRQKILLRALERSGFSDTLNKLRFDQQAKIFVARYASRAKSALNISGSRQGTDISNGQYPIASGAASKVSPRPKPNPDAG